MKRKVLALVLGTSLLATALVGCGGSGDTATEGDDTIKVALTVNGSFGDQGMNDALLNGANMFTEETGIEVSSVEIAELSDHAVTARNFAEQGYEVVIMGGPVSEFMPEIVEAYPDTHFILNKGTLEDYANVTSIQFDEAQPSFLGGVYAVLMSEHLGGTKSAGWVGGMRIPDLEKARYSFVAGAEYVGGKADVVYVGDFTDIAKAKEIALKMYNDGAKVVQAYAGGASNGVYQAADSLDNTYFAMGCATGQFEQSDKIITSVVVQYDEAISRMLVEFAENGSIESGVQVLNLETEGTGIKYAEGSETVIPDEIKTQIEELREQIIAGEIVVPTTEEEYNAFNK